MVSVGHKVMGKGLLLMRNYLKGCSIIIVVINFIMRVAYKPLQVVPLWWLCRPELFPLMHELTVFNTGNSTDIFTVGYHCLW